MRSIKSILCFLILNLTCVLVIYDSSFSGEFYDFNRMCPTLKQPWYSWISYDLAVDSRGYVYSADSLKGILYKYTTNGQLIYKKEVVNSNQLENFYVITGMDVVFSENYNFIYFINLTDVHKFSLDGNSIEIWKGETNEFNSPKDVAVDLNNHVYIAENNCVYKYSHDGEYILKFGESELRSVEYICANAGIVYATDKENNCVYIFSSQGEILHKIDALSSGYENFNSPAGIAVDSLGFIYVVDQGNCSIVKFNSDRQFIKSWGSKGKGNGQFYSPSGIAVDNKGFIYVADREYHRIQKFTTNGDFVDIWSGIGIRTGHFNEPDDIALDSKGIIYVADAENNRIQRFNQNLEFIDQWGEKGDGEGQFKIEINDRSDTSMGLAIDGNDSIYVTDTGNYRVQKFDSNKNFIKQWGKKGTGNGEFLFPSTIITDMDNNIYVSDINFSNQEESCIQKFSSNGEFILKIKSTQDYQIDYPTGMAFDNNNFLYIVGLLQILKFTHEGLFKEVWKEYPLPPIYRYPQSITTDNNGFIYVVEGLPFPLFKAQIQKFSSEGEHITTFGEFGSNAGQLYYPGDICVSNNGDKIYVSDRYNHRIQIFQQKFTSSNAKAIIVAGGGSDESNKIWKETEQSAHFAYRAMNYQGFSKDRIFYLSSNTKHDIDNNGQADDITEISNENLEYAITEWAKDADSLVVYLVGHGYKELFEMRRSPDPLTLKASTLNKWLDEIQQVIPGMVIFIYDACYAGSFLNELSAPDKQRIVITSTQSDESSKFLESIYFSNLFWSHIFNGFSLYEAFNYAKEACKYIPQTPLLDANGNGYGNEPDDEAEAYNVYIGNKVSINKDFPVIESVSQEQEIKNSSATIFAKVTGESIYRVWAVVTPPDFDLSEYSNKPLLSLPSFDLIHSGEGEYIGTYNNFDSNGVYKIAVYAKDRNGNISIPKATILTINSLDRRRAIIVGGWGESKSIQDRIERNSMLAFEALEFQGYSDNDIYFMSNETFTKDIDALSSISNLKYAITTWAKNNTKDIILYIVGEGENEFFMINQDEYLLVRDLANWLNELQQEILNNRIVKISLIYDASYSANFFPFLAQQERILIASTAKNQDLNFESNDNINFSYIFWKAVLDGNNVNDSFVTVRNTLQSIDKIDFETPHIDDNGNGIGNEKIRMGSLLPDSYLAKNYYIGLGIRLANNEQISEISPSQITEKNSAIIWIKNVVGLKELSKVWANIIQPDKTIYSVDLTYNPNMLRYEVQLDIDSSGRYNINIYAEDIEGKLSGPFTSKIEKVDSYEDDDTMNKATVININDKYPQKHDFHDKNDQDWVRFFGIYEETYIIEVSNLESTCNAVIDLYYHGDSSSKMSIDHNGYGGNEKLPWKCPKDGIYYLRITNADPYDYGDNTSYDLQINFKESPFPGDIIGVAYNNFTKQIIQNAIIKTSGNMASISNKDGYYHIFNHQIGNYTITVEADGYKLFEGEVEVKGLGTTEMNIPMLPEGVYSLVINKSDKGTILSDLPGIECGEDCYESYSMDSGAEITLTAIPHPGNKFENWSGDCSNSEKCILVIDGDKEVSAEFISSDSAEADPPPNPPEECNCFLESLFSDCE